MSLFFVDSGSDLDRDQVKKLGVESINQKYAINDNVMQFGEEFDFDKFYSKYKKGVCVNFVQMTMEEYIEIFEPCLSQGDDIIYVYSSAKLIDNTNLLLAKEQLLTKYPDRKFELVDSLNISIGQGLVSYDCALLYRKGCSVEEIAQQSNDIKNSYTMCFSTDSLEQISNNNLMDNNAIAGTSLNIKPILTINYDGEIELLDKVSGKKRVISKLIELCRQTGTNVADYPISIVYSNDREMAEELKAKIIESFGEDITILMSRMTPSNASLLGNNIIGLAFHVHKKKL